MTNIYANEIRKTGFVLESKVSEVLRREGWNVISNKYYEDDLEGNVREIDILAYKVAKIQQVNVYTTLLISCKKSEQDIWALLARPIELNNPNADWWPLHTWSNDKSILYHLGKAKMAKVYHDALENLGVIDALSTPSYEVFAFQEMNKKSGAPRNDTNIHKAVTSQAYEIGALSARKKTPSIYQFNLISIIDADLYRLVIEGDNISQQQIKDEHYISKYIIKKQETCSRIRFVAAQSFGEILKDYNRLHIGNTKWFNEGIDSFYKDILTDYSRAKILLPEFRAEVEWLIHHEVRKIDGLQLAKDEIIVSWNKKEKYAEVSFWEIKPYLPQLNSNEQLKNKVSAALKKVYRYTGEFWFAEDDIPF